MDREEYFDYLRTLNGYCGCLELQELYGQRRKAENLEAKCNPLTPEAELENPREDDKEFLLKYKETGEEFHKIVNEYHASLRTTLEQGKIKAHLHNNERFGEKRYISVNEMDEILKVEEAPIITLHCVKCDQQIDIRAIKSLSSMS